MGDGKAVKNCSQMEDYRIEMRAHRLVRKGYSEQKALEIARNEHKLLSRERAGNVVTWFKSDFMRH